VPTQINKYPAQRTFTAIGSGGEEFAKTMVAAVESVVGGVHMECIAQTPSSGNKYLSVRIGPVWVKNADQVRLAAAHSCVDMTATLPLGFY
jgi:putative lipoic acid-binding regulatory protein